MAGSATLWLTNDEDRGGKVLAALPHWARHGANPGVRMVRHRHIAVVSALTLSVLLSACGGGGLFGNGNRTTQPVNTTDTSEISQVSNTDQRAADDGRLEGRPRARIWDLFTKNANPNVTVKVNKYIWNASLDVLNFLPIQSVDPFSGVIVTGYGTPPGGGRSYRATIYVQDPALDAR